MQIGIGLGSCFLTRNQEAVFKFMEKVVKKSDEISISSELVGKIFEALELIKDFPGVSDAIKELNEFSKNESKSIALNDLSNLMVAPGDPDIVGVTKAIAIISKTGWNIQAEDAVQEKLDEFLRKVVQQFFAKASHEIELV